MNPSAPTTATRRTRGSDALSASRMALTAPKYRNCERAQARKPCTTPGPAGLDGCGLEPGTSGTGQAAGGVPVPERVPEKGCAMRVLFGAVAGARVAGLVEFTAAWRPDRVVFDPLTYAAPIAARLAGIPAVRHLFGPDVNYFTHQGEVERLAPVLSRFGLAEVDLLG